MVSPLYHIMFLRALDTSAQQFFRDKFVWKPFGDGPWPCLNPACQNYKKNVIDELQTVSHSPGVVRGIFSCTCGFTYSRLGPDKAEEDRFRYSRVLDRGHVWESSFKELWDNSDLALVSGAKCRRA